MKFKVKGKLEKLERFGFEYRENDNVYAKQFNMNGTPILLMYVDVKSKVIFSDYGPNGNKYHCSFYIQCNNQFASLIHKLNVAKMVEEVE